MRRRHIIRSRSWPAYSLLPGLAFTPGLSVGWSVNAGAFGVGSLTGIYARSSPSRARPAAARIRLALARVGIRVCERTVAASMRRQQLVPASSRLFVKPCRKVEAEEKVVDLCGRCWDQGGLDLVWVTDFTYLRCGEGWVYLVAVRDAHSRRVVGWAMAEHMRTGLVIDALEMAFEIRGRVPAQIVLHADRGAQFTSSELKAYLDAVGGRVSAGRTGVCWDNAMAESFWASLKVEHFYRHAYTTREQVYESVDEWIDVFYNRQRIHTALGGLSPVEYELALATQQREAA